jgi:hypothetical protein
MRVLVLMLVLLPQMATAAVYMCKDPVSGKTTFSDKGCATSATREEIRIQDTNLDSGRRTTGAADRKAWVSDRDTRKTGRDHFAAKRDLLGNRATARAGALAYSDDS